MSNQGEVYFSLHGEAIDHDALTRSLGVEPTSASNRGEPPTRKDGVWRLSSGTITSERIDVCEMSSTIVARLADSVPQIQSAMRQQGLQAALNVVLHVSLDEAVSMPAVGFTPEVVAFLAAVDASIDVDIYRNWDDADSGAGDRAEWRTEQPQ